MREDRRRENRVERERGVEEAGTGKREKRDKRDKREEKKESDKREERGRRGKNQVLAITEELFI